MGPPSEPPKLRNLVSTRVRGALFGPPYLLKALRPGSLYLRKRLPWKVFVPFCETTLICAPELRPSSAE
jgi:hypothetical protein